MCDDKGSPASQPSMYLGQGAPALRFRKEVQGEGLLRCELELTNRRPDPALLLKRALGANGPGSGGSAGGGGGSSPGNTISGGGDGGNAPTWQANDADVAQRSRLDFQDSSDLAWDLADGGEDNDRVTVQATVQGLLGHPIDTPVSGSYLQYNGTTHHMEWGTASSSSPVQSAYYWSRSDLSAAPTSASPMPWLDGMTLPLIISTGCRLSGISIYVPGSVGASGTSYQVEVWADTGSGWAATGLSYTVAGGVSGHGGSATLGSPLSLPQGTLLTIYETRTGTLNAIGARAGVAFT